MRSTAWIIGCLVLLVFGGCHHKKTAAELKNAADSLARMPDPGARLIALDKLIADQPNDAKLYMERSKTYDELGNLDKALENAKTAIEKDSTQTPYFFYMADLFMKKPSVKNAVNIMDRLKLSQPKNYMADIKIAEFYLKAGKNDESMHAIDDALKINPNIPEAYFWRGYNFREVKNQDKAIANFQKAIELKPDYEDAYVILGLLYEDKKDHKAEEYFTSAIRLNAKDTVAIYDLGKYYQDRDSFQKAIDNYKEILEMDPNNRNANFAIGYCLYYLKDYNNGLGYFSKVLLVNPKDAAAHDGRSLCFRGMGEIDKANKEKEIADRLSEK